MSSDIDVNEGFTVRSAPFQSRLVPAAVLKRLSYYRQAATAVAYARERLLEPIRLENVAAVVGMNPAAFSRFFADKVGMTFFGLLRTLRIEQALEELERRDCSVAVLADRAGYQSACTFARAFKDVTGETPSEYRRRFLSLN